MIDGWCQMRLSEEPAKPSRVLHLRGLPPETTEAEITTLTTLFGVATNIILTRQKNQVVFERHVRNFNRGCHLSALFNTLTALPM